jgi:hypothetical protein
VKLGQVGEFEGPAVFFGDGNDLFSDATLVEAIAPLLCNQAKGLG